MGNTKRAVAPKATGAFDWAWVSTERVEHEPSTVIFSQGDPAASIMFVEKGAVRLSVVSRTGKEAVVGVLDSGHFVGEGCLAGQTRRMATATAVVPSTLLTIDKAADPP